jgi:hypothetical protein
MSCQRHVYFNQFLLSKPVGLDTVLVISTSAAGFMGWQFIWITQLSSKISEA